MLTQFGFSRKFEKIVVVPAICSGFKETTDPPIYVCRGIFPKIRVNKCVYIMLSTFYPEELETNECLERNASCWIDIQNGISAFKDTYRGRVCECPTISGVQFLRDGYMRFVKVYGIPFGRVFNNTTTPNISNVLYNIGWYK
ncbi:hypothetical protein Hanom_Chr06g00558241 [Helianthus anomalus]